MDKKIKQPKTQGEGRLSDCLGLETILLLKAYARLKLILQPWYPQIFVERDIRDTGN